MLRSRVVIDLLAARQAARQSGEQSWAKSQPSTRIRNRPALQSSSSPKVQSRPFQRQDLSTAAPRISTLGAQSVIARLQARRERLATACPSSDKASIPGKRESWASIRQRHATRPYGGALSEKQAPRQPLITHRARQIPPVAVKLNQPARQSSPVNSVTTGSSFSFIAPNMVAQATSPPCPMTPNAPRAGKFRNVSCQPVSIALPVKSSKVPLRGILKRNGQHRRTAGRGLRWAEKLTTERIVERWIDEPCAQESPEVVVKKSDHVHPDPARYTGRLRSWPGPNGRENYLTGDTLDTAQHADCQSPDCNKKQLHQCRGRASMERNLNRSLADEMPPGMDIWMFNAGLNFTFRRARPVGERLPKDVGLEDWRLS
ncbi:MAG: hypothetical protein Q9209_006333 [Squamulea sp. 1 TL-2023]